MYKYNSKSNEIYYKIYTCKFSSNAGKYKVSTHGFIYFSMPDKMLMKYSITDWSQLSICNLNNIIVRWAFCIDICVTITTVITIFY